MAAPFFLAKITDVSAAPSYQWVEVWDQGAGSLVELIGGRRGTAVNPGVAVTGATFAVNEIALCRQSDGRAGLRWELIKLGSSVSAWKEPVRARTTAALPTNTYANGTSGVGATLTGNANGALTTQDGVTLVLDQSLLVANEATASRNGIYTLTQVGSGSLPYILTRRPDADTASELLGAAVVVLEGTLYADTVWLGTANANITVGTTALPWAQIGGAAPLTSGLSSGFGPVTLNNAGVRIQTLNLPAAGTYLLQGAATLYGGVSAIGSSGSPDAMRMAIETATGGVIGNSAKTILQFDVIGTKEQAGSVHWLLTTAGAVTVYLWASATATISPAAAYEMVFTFVKVA